MNDKAGTMGSGAMWGFVIGSSVLGGVLSFVLSSTGLTDALTRRRDSSAGPRRGTSRRIAWKSSPGRAGT